MKLSSLSLSSLLLLSCWDEQGAVERRGGRTSVSTAATATATAASAAFAPVTTTVTTMALSRRLPTRPSSATSGRRTSRIMFLRGDDTAAAATKTTTKTTTSLAAASSSSSSSSSAGRSDDEEDKIIDAIIEEVMYSSSAADIDAAAEAAAAAADAAEVGGGNDEDRSMRPSNGRDFEFKLVPREKEERRRKRDILRASLRKLASLSLEDYKWRSSIFKRNEADRKIEESLARMMGEDPSYVRPMDATDEKIGPLGRAEKTLVKWLSKVIEEEGKRAKKIADADGDLVRPMDGDGGPLADLERGAVSFVDAIRAAERERFKSGALVRPKDVEASKRGPLGEAEFRITAALEQISNAERLRFEQSLKRGGEVVRPIDVPGPLGEVERSVVEMMRAEKQRAKDRAANEGKLVRPMNASMPSPLGEAERLATSALDRLREEETERLNNIRRVLEERRPMESDRDSPLGMTEAFTVGLLRGPRLLAKVADRVRELMRSKPLAEDDRKLLVSAADPSDGDGKNEPDAKRDAVKE